MGKLVLVTGDDGLCSPFVMEHLSELLCLASELEEKATCKVRGVRGTEASEQCAKASEHADSLPVRFECNGG